MIDLTGVIVYVNGIKGRVVQHKDGLVTIRTDEDELIEIEDYKFPGIKVIEGSNE